ncbi:MAG: cytochrome c [Rhodospirillales bacterium]|nr:cytochrome c [Rhodospirillales bacterium]
MASLVRRRWLAAMLVAGGAWLWWSSLPRTAEELFRDRCRRCHNLPDMSRYRSDEMAGIVRMMRERNGADGVIDETEAKNIVEYLEGLESR